ELFVLYFYFFFQAEDGIRDWSVTGVQTCALPIFSPMEQPHDLLRNAEIVGLFHRAEEFGITVGDWKADYAQAIQRSRRVADRMRSEERRVGKECRTRWGEYQ